MVSLWHLPNMEICKSDVCVYMRAHICNKTCFECFGVAWLVLSIHDNFGDEDGILEDFYGKKVKDILNKIHTTSHDARWT